VSSDNGELGAAPKIETRRYRFVLCYRARMTSTPPSTTGDVPRAGRPRDPQRDAAILQACAELLLADGYDRLSMDAIATKAGVGKATVYRRWPSKGAVVIDAFARLKPALSPIDTGSLEGDLDALRAAYCGSKSRDALCMIRGIAAALPRDDDLKTAFQERFAAPRRERIEQILRRAHDRGELHRDIDVPFVAEVFPSMMFQHLIVQGEPPSPAHVARVIDQVLRPLLGLAPTATPPANGDATE
jgi:AcrR family transcriptional regulator